MKIAQCNSTWNTTYSKNRPKLYIALHYTTSQDSNKGRAIATCKYWANPVVQASADFAVDDIEAAQYNGDINNRYCWAIGGGKNKYPTNTLANKYNGIATNKNTISIELCSSKKKKVKNPSASERDWYFTNAVLNNGLELTRYLMKLYNIPVEHVITHNAVTGKLCPANWSWDEKALGDFKVFINHLKNGTNYSGTVAPSIPLTNYVFNGVDLAPVFSSTYYADKYADLKKVFGYNEKLLFEHFCTCGMKEARQAISTFNPITYRQKYADLSAAFGNNWLKYYAHYCTSGIKEGRKGI